MKYLNFLSRIPLKIKIPLIFLLLVQVVMARNQQVDSPFRRRVNALNRAGMLHWRLSGLKTHASFRSLSAAGPQVFWAAGSGATWIRSVNGGKEWEEHTFRGADSVLDFRGLAALDGRMAWLMSSGESEKGLARIYRTLNGGRSWTLQYKADSPGIFLDGIRFWDQLHGIAFGDPVQGHFYILLTQDGGLHWIPQAAAGSPSANTAEAAFAASGTSLIIRPQGRAWMATGGKGGGRVFTSRDYGHSWESTPTGLKSGDAAGIFGLCFLNDLQGIALGGDYIHIHDGQNNAAMTSDGGRTWVPALTTPQGLREAAVFIPARHLLVAVGPSGTSTSPDSGKHWMQQDTLAFHTIAGSHETVWAIGGHGHLATLQLPAE